MQALLQTTTHYTPANIQVDLPAILVQVTEGVGMYMIWAGTTHASDPQRGDKDAPGSNAESGMDAIVQQGRLGADWACSMASKNVSEVPLETLDLT